MSSSQRALDAAESKVETEAGGGDEYKFRFTERKHYTDKSVVEITGKLQYRGENIGSMEAYLFMRKKTPQSGWYSKCDAVSQETQECCVSFFEDNGTLQPEFASKVSAQCNTGGYLHIVSVEIDAGHRGKDLGVRFVKNVLDHLARRWTLAMIQPYPLVPSEEDGAFQTAILHLSRYFARLGFAQCCDNEHSAQIKFWYLDATRYTGEILDRAATSELKVAVPVSDPPVSEIDKEVVQLINDFPDSTPVEVQMRLSGAFSGPHLTMLDFKNSMRALLERGGNFKSANALQIAVAGEKLNILDAMIELGADVNAQDFGGSTALHVAAAMMNVQAVEQLLRRGADKHIRNKENATPLQALEAMQKTFHQFRLCFGVPQRDDGGAAYALLLR